MLLYLTKIQVRILLLDSKARSRLFKEIYRICFLIQNKRNLISRTRIPYSIRRSVIQSAVFPIQVKL